MEINGSQWWVMDLFFRKVGQFPNTILLILESLILTSQFSYSATGNPPFAKRVGVISTRHPVAEILIVGRTCATTEIPGIL